jgi:hypothetical protein
LAFDYRLSLRTQSRKYAGICKKNYVEIWKKICYNMQENMQTNMLEYAEICSICKICQLHFTAYFAYSAYSNMQNMQNIDSELLFCILFGI